MMIRKLKKNENAPKDLLLLADPSRSMIDDYLKRGECYVAEIDMEVVGTYVVLPTRPGTIELVNLAVREDFQGRSIGKELLLHSIERAREKGAVVMEVGTGNSSLSQLALYQKCGFRIVGVEREYFTQHYEEAIFENGIQCRDMIRLSVVLK